MKRRKLNNRGAALISVLVVTTFITILATTMLYIAAMNFQQKQTDYQNKQSFYGAEKALDELKSLLVRDVEDAYVTAYNKTTRNFLKLDASGRESYFQEQFMDEMKKKWKTRVDTVKVHSVPDESDYLKAVQSVMTGAYAAEADSFYKVKDYGVYETTEAGKVKQKFALRGVQVKYTSGNYTTFLYTDICIEPPQAAWAVDSFSSTSEPGAKEREQILFTDYVSYVNWRKADYENSESDLYDAIKIGDNAEGIK